MEDYVSKKDAEELLGIDEKTFENYFKKSGELNGYKIKNRWYFKKDELAKWKKNKESRTINLTIKEYEKCFEFAIKMVYGGLSLHGIRGQRSEVQASDDIILGILAEYALKRFLDERFNTYIELDEEIHTEEITPQDIHKILDGNQLRTPRIGVGVKASKMKNAFLVLGANEVELEDRASNIYVFVRVGLPSDHLFRLLRDHSFFKRAKDFLENDRSFRNIEEMEDIPVWICGFVEKDNLDMVTSIPGQDFTNGHRYVKSVAQLKNTDEDWTSLIKLL